MDRQACLLEAVVLSRELHLALVYKPVHCSRHRPPSLARVSLLHSHALTYPPTFTVAEISSPKESSSVVPCPLSSPALLAAFHLGCEVMGLYLAFSWLFGFIRIFLSFFHPPSPAHLNLSASNAPLSAYFVYIKLSPSLNGSIAMAPFNYVDSTCSPS